jgi:tetratricopeptide (TPR) repeat protein
MKLKSVLAPIFISLLALVLVIAFTVPAAAQKADKKKITWKEMIAKVATGPKNESNKSDYWFEKGALCATYGNDRAAINYFQKVISIDPNRSGAYFEQGISYGQLGFFGQAITLVSKAIEMEPKNGLYLYGRGRLYLLAGKQGQAMEDFKKAAELDDEDAQNYLKYVAQLKRTANHQPRDIKNQR